jgi:three-Cys-motif partner protein
MPRDWGPWTVIKLEALEKYLSAFAVASQKARVTLYLDLFGGRPDNRGRGTDEVFEGSALRAAQVVPPFSKLIVTELSRSAAADQRARLDLVAPGRAIVREGDCNVVMPAELAKLDRDYRWAATFALVDQYSAEVRWETLRKIAAFKDPSAKTKAEICMYFGPSFMLRGLHGPGGKVNAGYARRLDDMYGNTRWRQIMAAREDGAISGDQAGKELVNLMRWQLEEDLGYRTTLPLQVRNTVNNKIFSLVFATDHPVGTKIMRDLFEGAENALDLMVLQGKVDRARAKDEASGQGWLLGDDDLAVSLPGEPTSRTPLGPPVEPYEWGRLWDRDQR